MVFAVVFVLVAFWPLLHGGAPRWWAIVIAAILAGVATFLPNALATPNRLWAKFGMLLGTIASPVVTGVIFFVVLSPVAFVMRVTGRDALRLKRAPKSDSYWVARPPSAAESTSMRNQY
ncbi:MAG: SxtJ family membrane protein [Alphaproteobacteria bacterium]